MTRDLVDKLDMYVFQKQGNDWKVSDKEWENVRDQLVTSRVNGGHPVIMVKDGDYSRNGEIFLQHHYEGMELDVKYLEKTLPHIYALWGRNVHLQTVIDKREVVFTYNGKKCVRRFL